MEKSIVIDISKDAEVYEHVVSASWDMLKERASEMRQYLVDHFNIHHDDALKYIQATWLYINGYDDYIGEVS